jgi:hypothetical protein
MKDRNSRAIRAFDATLTPGPSPAGREGGDSCGRCLGGIGRMIGRK